MYMYDSFLQILITLIQRFDCTCTCTCIYCVDLGGKAPFKSSGITCWSPPPSSLPGELSMDKRDSIGFF